MVGDQSKLFMATVKEFVQYVFSIVFGMYRTLTPQF